MSFFQPLYGNIRVYRLIRDRRFIFLLFVIIFLTIMISNDMLTGRKLITVRTDKSEAVYRTTSSRVDVFLREIGIVLEPNDTLSVGLFDVLYDSMEIKITRHQRRLITEDLSVSPGTLTFETMLLEKGQTLPLIAGKNGLERRHYQATFVGGVEVERRLLSTEILVRGIPQIIAIGKGQKNLLRKNSKGKFEVRMKPFEAVNIPPVFLGMKTAGFSPHLIKPGIIVEIEKLGPCYTWPFESSEVLSFALDPLTFNSVGTEELIVMLGPAQK